MSRGLGQGELLEAAPVKRLIVPLEQDSWWGVDPSTLRVALGTVTPEERRGVTVVGFPRSKGVERLKAIRSETYSLARATAHLVPPGVIACEQPSGKTVNLELAYAVGVIVEALATGAESVTGWRPRVVMVTSSAWKSVACGKGNIYKPKGAAARVEDYGVLRWAKTLGYAGTSWDAADSYGIAEWARRTYALEAR